LDFSDAAEKLDGAFMFRGEARKGQWGMLGDVFFIGLSTDVNYTTPILSVPIAGTLEMDETVFNGKVTYELKPGSRFHLVGGVRTMTMAPTVHFTGPTGGQLTDIDVSRTVVAAVGGFIYRPRLGKRAALLTQADIGGGRHSRPVRRRHRSAAQAVVGRCGGVQPAPLRHGQRPDERNGAVDVLETTVTQSGPYSH
jgi:hypothetical protein